MGHSHLHAPRVVAVGPVLHDDAQLQRVAAGPIIKDFGRLHSLSATDGQAVDAHDEVPDGRRPTGVSLLANLQWSVATRPTPAHCKRLADALQAETS